MIYAIEAGSGGPIKFGKAEKPWVRRADLQTAHYADLRLLTSVAWPDDAEKWIHQYIGHHRIRGEWFERVPHVMWVVDLMVRGNLTALEVACGRKNFSWPEVVMSLQVSGAARELARFVSFKEIRDDRYVLVLSESLKHLAEKSVVTGLEDALTAHGFPGHIDVEISDKTPLDDPFVKDLLAAGATLAA